MEGVHKTGAQNKTKKSFPRKIRGYFSSHKGQTQIQLEYRHVCTHSLYICIIFIISKARQTKCFITLFRNRQKLADREGGGGAMNQQQQQCTHAHTENSLVRALPPCQHTGKKMNSPPSPPCCLCEASRRPKVKRGQGERGRGPHLLNGGPDESFSGGGTV